MVLSSFLCIIPVQLVPVTLEQTVSPEGLRRTVAVLYSKPSSLGNLLSNGGSFLGVLSKAFCALQSHLKFLPLFSGGGGSLYLLFGATG